jgi:purine-cytosine permease-like protein
VASFFTPNGIYGRIQWWACLCYVITLAVQVPFLDPTFYVGPLVAKMGGADISWIVGFGVVWHRCYTWLGRSGSRAASRPCPLRPIRSVRLRRVRLGGGVS